MDKTGDDEPGFAFARLAGADNYKKWARGMRCSLESAGLCDHTLPEKEKHEPVPIALKDKDSHPRAFYDLNTDDDPLPTRMLDTN